MDSITAYLENQIREMRKQKENPLYECDYQEQLQVYEDKENNHGRCERRTYYLSYDPSCIEGTEFKSVSALGYVIRERKIPRKNKDGWNIEYEKSVDKISYIMGREMETKDFARYVRDHWRIENTLHWILDHSFKEDRSTAKKRNAIANISFFKKMAYNIISIYRMTHPNGTFE